MRPTALEKRGWHRIPTVMGSEQVKVCGWYSASDGVVVGVVSGSADAHGWALFFMMSGEQE
jgi:hypothetical protein